MPIYNFNSSVVTIGSVIYTEDYTIPSGVTASLFGPITFTGTVTIDGTLHIF